jgi:CTP synthase
MTKYIFVTGGVVSGLGKGITASSVGALLKSRGLKVFVQKFDPYLNVDPGTMSPYQHGEVFVTDDGTETDLDLGHYERFIGESLSHLSSLTTGMIYSRILDSERKGDFLGQTVQVVPHVTNEIKRYIYKATEEIKPDIQIIEIGGTVGDIESLPFLEAVRQIKLEVGVNNVVFIHTTLLPYLNTSHELKTKPTQHSINTLMGLGITPDFIVLRADRDIPDNLKEKISSMCTIAKEKVIALPDLNNIYEVPLYLHKQNMDNIICNMFKINRKVDIKKWEDLIDKCNNLKGEVIIGVVGKYVDLEDAYFSVREALKHAGIHSKTKVNIKWINSENICEDNVNEILENVDGILVPGGFGNRGINGKILAIKYARENKIPFFGICLGMQLAIIEYARNVLGLTDADSTEFNPHTTNPIIDYLPNQYKGINLGGTMRIGSYECRIRPNTLAHKIYGEKLIAERHRHRYEFNNNFKEIMEKNNIVFSGINPLTNLVEITELKKHPYFIGVQFHPEFKSRPIKAHPLFASFINAAIKYQSNLKK